MLSVGVPVLVEGRTVGTLLTGGLLGETTGLQILFLASVNRAIWLAGGTALIVAALMGGLLLIRLTRPLRELSAAALHIAGGDLQQRVASRSKDELGLLGESFNTMAKKLARSERLRRNMVADIAHELRTPLTVLQGNLEALREGVFEPTQAIVKSMHEESRLLVRLVGDLRELSLAEAGELPLARQIADMRGIATRVAATIRPQVEQKGVAFALDLPPEAVAVFADPDRIAQVLLNLLSNAQRYVPEGGRIALSVERRPAEVVVRVSDSGPGIGPADLPNVFERFWRGERSRGRKTGGSGLGLAIARQLILGHGGRIWVESTPGQGAIFTFALPLAPAGKTQAPGA
jgi:signal transduction histidine kinase